jgi:penicillin-binding protein 1A
VGWSALTDLDAGLKLINPASWYALLMLRALKLIPALLLLSSVLVPAHAQQGPQRIGDAIQGWFNQPGSAMPLQRQSATPPPRRDSGRQLRKAEQLYRTGRSYVERGYYGEALEALNQSLALNPDFAPALTYKGIALRLMREPQLALEQFDQAIAKSPNDGIAHGERGLTYLMLGQRDQANEDLRRSAQLQPDLAPWYAYHSRRVAEMQPQARSTPQPDYQPKPIATPAAGASTADQAHETGDQQPGGASRPRLPHIEWSSIWAIVRPALWLAFALLAIAIMLRVAFGILRFTFRRDRGFVHRAQSATMPAAPPGDYPPPFPQAPAAPAPLQPVVRARRFFRAHRLFLYAGAACALVGLTLAAPAVVQAFRLDPEKLVAAPMYPAVLDYKGNLYTRIGPADKPITFEDLPTHLVDALRAREDSRFFEHHGVDWYGFARALVTDLSHLKIKQGASTLTMQLVEKSYQLDQKGLGNRLRSKLVEWTTAYRCEAYLADKLGSQRAAKQAIMTAYLNRVEFGDGTVGVGAASQYYFEKPVAELTLGESCMLVALLRAPYANSPYRKPENSRLARDKIVAQMVRRGTISEAQAKQARFFVVPNPKKPRPHHNGYLVAAITREINALKASGKLPADVWQHENLSIQSTLDLWAQELLDSEVRKVCSSFRGDTEEDPLGGAAMLLDNATGQVRALVSGQDYTKSQYDLALRSRRQIASIAKPFIYAAYVEQGGGIEDMCSNAPLAPEEVQALNKWNPDNASSLAVGEHPVSTGLAFSDNYVTVRVALRAGLPRVYQALYAAGLVGDKATTGPTWLLGTFECSLADAVSAYTAFARGGTRAIPYLVDRVTIDGKEVYHAQPQQAALFSAQTAQQVHQGLRKAMTEGTGRSALKNAGLDIAVAGKTGTSQNAADVWWIGYVKDVTLGVRFGRTSNASLGDSVAGGTMAAPVAARVLKKLAQRYELRNAYGGE